MGYTHLSITERSQLEILHRLEWSNREIGKALRAEARKQRRDVHGGDCTGCAAELAGELEKKLQQTWSPDR